MKKKVIILLSSLFLCVFVSTAQQQKHEVRLGVGIGTSSEIIDVFSDIITTGLTAGLYTSDASYTGGFQAGYKYTLTERVGIGGSFVYEHSSADAFFNKEQTGEFNKNYYTLAGEVEYRYVNKSRLCLYLMAGAGATFIDQKYKRNEGGSESDDMTHFNFHFSPLAIKYGGRVGFFAELGFGYKGILSAGAYARF